MKIIVIACGIGIATSTLISEEVNLILEEKDISAYLIQCRISELDAYAEEADLILTAMDIDAEQGQALGTPVLTAIPLLTDINREEFIEKMLKYLS
ncbi:PTS galactitol transporter subunit IIB [Chakrabartyella piscis]|uniref:PTS sugar transporter subunit IIB n=1 Tax=Chakrabartyella piscis TaxID=2918914 RepID=UPI002958ABCF|nr:PTS galactitol transporter subunit IIB [Chakrabartyella piscis]